MDATHAIINACIACAPVALGLAVRALQTAEAAHLHGRALLATQVLTGAAGRLAADTLAASGGDGAKAFAALRTAALVEADAFGRDVLSAAAEVHGAQWGTLIDAIMRNALADAKLRAVA
jgi:hypothetical protein